MAKNVKRKWKQLKAKKNPKINTEALKGLWDTNKSIANNYMDLGLSIDPNKTLAIPKTKDKVNPQNNKQTPEIMDIEEVIKWVLNE